MKNIRKILVQKWGLVQMRVVKELRMVSTPTQRATGMSRRRKNQSRGSYEQNEESVQKLEAEGKGEGATLHDDTPHARWQGPSAAQYLIG